MKTLYDEKDLWWQDKFELHEDHGYWIYYNADGNDGNGQVVEVCIYPCNILINAITEDEFWDYLSSMSPTYLYDRGCDDFDEYVKELLEQETSKDRRYDSSQNTMQWLISWAKKYI